MKKDFETYILLLRAYKVNHHFKWVEIADMLNVTTRSLRRWVRKEYIPLPIYQEKIIRLLK